MWKLKLVARLNSSKGRKNYTQIVNFTKIETELEIKCKLDI